MSKIYRIINKEKDVFFTITLDPHQQHRLFFSDIKEAQEYLGALPSFCVPETLEEKALPMHVLEASKYGMPTYEMAVNLNGLIILGDEGEPDLAPYAIVDNLETDESMAIYPYSIVCFFKHAAFVHATRMD